MVKVIMMRVIDFNSFYTVVKVWQIDDNCKNVVVNL